MFGNPGVAGIGQNDVLQLFAPDRQKKLIGHLYLGDPTDAT
jgi:hypothetical protein